MESLPFVDDHARVIAAEPDRTWQALVAVLGGFPALPGLLTSVWGLDPPSGNGWADPAPGDAVAGFAVAETDPPRTLVLRGRHRFSCYEVRFTLSPVGFGRTELHARTAAAFPGLLGRGYRLAVISSGGHVLAVRRLLARSLGGPNGLRDRPRAGGRDPRPRPRSSNAGRPLEYGRPVSWAMIRAVGPATARTGSSPHPRDCRDDLRSDRRRRRHRRASGVCADKSMRSLYVGSATKLRSRLGQNHMKRTGSSTLRRAVAGLLLDDEAFRSRWTDRVVLVDEDEVRLTSWMETNLRVSWCEHPTPRDVERAIIEDLALPLNVDHASGSARGVIEAARRRYSASAGPQPTN